MHIQLVRAAISAGLAAIALSVLTPGPVRAEAQTASPGTPEPRQSPATDGEKKPKSVYDRIWAVPVLYSNSDNPWVQEFAIVGRQQVDFLHFDGDGVGEVTDFVNRRTRIGFKTKFLKTLTLHTEVDLNLEPAGEVYSKLTDAYLKWSPKKWLNVTFGKHGVKFTLDGSTSSTQLITIDRSNIANNFWFPEEYLSGISVSGDVGNWQYNTGVFRAGDSNSEFGDFEGDHNVGDEVLLVSGGYNFAKKIGADKAVVRADYVYQNPDPDNDFTRPNEHVGSVNLWLEKGPWGLGVDVDAAKGYGSQSDLYGTQIMPSYRFCETWQAVFRYTYIHSTDDNGIRLARYENRLVSGRGDEYHEAYLGLNKYFYGHKLKWQTGIQYADMTDSARDGGAYEGFGITTGLRISW